MIGLPKGEANLMTTQCKTADELSRMIQEAVGPMGDWTTIRVFPLGEGKWDATFTNNALSNEVSSNVIAAKDRLRLLYDIAG